MAKFAHSLLRKVSSVSASAAALLAGSSAVGTPVGDPDTAKRTQDALDVLKRASGADAGQISFQVGGQVDPETQEILLAGHTSHSSHSSHSSGSYIRGSGSSYSTPSYTPSYAPSYTPSSSRSSTAPEATPTYTPSYSTPAYTAPFTPSTNTSAASTAAATAPTAGPKVKVAYRSGMRLSGSVIQKGSWGLQLLLKDASRIQIPRHKLRAEDILSLDLPVRPDDSAPDVPPMVYLRLKDGNTYTGRVSASEGGKITLVADDSTSQTFRRAEMDSDTFTALQGLVPDAPLPSVPTSTLAQNDAASIPQPTPAAIGQKVLIKLKNGTAMLVTLLSRSDDGISIRDKDGHEYRLAASRLSKESLKALGMPVPEPAPMSTPKSKKQT